MNNEYSLTNRLDITQNVGGRAERFVHPRPSPIEVLGFRLVVWDLNRCSVHRESAVPARGPGLGPIRLVVENL